MNRIGYHLKLNSNVYHKIHGFLILILLASFFLITINPIQATSIVKDHNNITGNITDPECIICHPVQKNQLESEKIQLNNPSLKKTASGVSINSLSQVGDNYTAILTFGQTPYQLGPFSRRGETGWSWWDSKWGTEVWGKEIQKNLIALMVLNKTTGKPVTGLTSTTWPQASFRNYSGIYSYKADTAVSPVTTQTNYPHLSDIWMIREIDLSGYSNANLTFWTWYSMETDWDYGYVAVFDGNKWNNLPGTITTTIDPTGNNLGNGITGSSNDLWVQETMDLTPYAGKKIILGFRFKSDEAVNGEGWYVDDIVINSGMTTIFFDDSENFVAIKTLSVNVSYPHLTLEGITDPLTSGTTLNYTQYIQQVNLFEDLGHRGTYFGYFQYSPFADQYSGNYTVSLDTTINGTPVTASTQFQTTIFGCQNCHNTKTDQNGITSETSFIHGEGGGSLSCMYMCHSGSVGYVFTPLLTLNPMHVHEMKYGHELGFIRFAWGNPQLNYTVPSHVTATSCKQCHTEFIHDNIGTDSETIANYTLYGTNISYSTGTHKDLSCEYCHGDLNYPTIPQDQYQLPETLGDYNPTFTSHESFADTFIIDVNGQENLTINIIGNNTAKHVLLHVAGPVDNTSTALQSLSSYGGGSLEIQQSLSIPINVEVAAPYIGTWIAKLNNLQEGLINYTIESNYPIQRKPIIRIPECNSCHNSNGVGKASTNDQIPDWNPGFAHVDTNNDGTPDIQCRMCHNAMHDITVKDCQTCHTTAPTKHPITEPVFSQYDQSQCLSCHGSPHNVSAEGTCISCHPTVTSPDLGQHSIFNGTSDVDNGDCRTCHFAEFPMEKGAVNNSNTYFCADCHTTAGTGPKKSLIKFTDKLHGENTCMDCHVADGKYHQGNPRGSVANLIYVNRYVTTNTITTDCSDCHYAANLDDAPFNAPGGGSHIISNGAACAKGGCHPAGTNMIQTIHKVGGLSSATQKPTISVPTLSSSNVMQGTNVIVTATVNHPPANAFVDGAQYRIKSGATEVRSWTPMSANDGNFNGSSELAVATIKTNILSGTYTIEVRGMAGGPAQNTSMRYYPMNGNVSAINSATLTVLAPMGYINGTVKSGITAIEGVFVSVPGASDTTKPDGTYSLRVPQGTYTVNASKQPTHYDTSVPDIGVMQSNTTIANISISQKLTGTISGTVRNA